MRVLVTRPEPGAARTAERLSRLGHDAALMPLFQATVTASLDDLPPVPEISGLIATSARAFDMFEGVDVAAAGIANLPVNAVGPATAQAAREAGFANVLQGGGTARALSQELAAAEAQSPGDFKGNLAGSQKVLVYLAGEPRTPVIEAALEAQKIDHVVVECYKMSEISYSTDIVISDILSPAPDVILLYSSRAARRFTALTSAENMDDFLRFSRFLCLSASISSELPAEWQARALVAERPEEDSLIRSLAKLA